MPHFVIPAAVWGCALCDRSHYSWDAGLAHLSLCTLALQVSVLQAGWGAVRS